MPTTDPKPPEDLLLKVEEAEALHGEIARLPERYRAPVVLCDLEGLTHQEAATLLQCPSGTVAIRLKRARERLRVRLGRRGLDPSAGLMAINGPGMPPSLPSALIEATVRASTATGTASASALSLARGVELTMTYARGKVAAAGAVLVLGLASTWGLAGGFRDRPEEQTQPVAPEVEVARVVAREVRDDSTWVGRTEPSRSLEIRANVAGRLETAYFPEGKRVKEGDLLFEIDRKEARPALELADARVLQAEARLKREIERNRRLQAQQSTAQGQLDEASADLARAKAELGVAESARDQARLVLASTRIRASFDGVISRSLVAPGDPIKASKTVLATLDVLDPIAIVFGVAERTWLGLRRQKLAELATNGLVVLPIRVGLSSEKSFPRPGMVRLGEEKLDPSSGVARFRAMVSNADHVILPGMFAMVRMEVGEPHEALLVPDAAVATDGGREFLYTINDRDVVEVRPVKVGQLHDDLRVVIEGVKPGDRVVVGGLKDVRPGMTVKPRSTAAPHP